MKKQQSVFMVLAFMITAFSCKPKTVGSSGSEMNINAAPADQIARSESKAAEAVIKPVPRVSTLEQTNIIGMKSPSFRKLDQELIESLALISPPKNKEEDDVINALCSKTLERKKDLLFSIPITPQAQRDCEEAWKALESESLFDSHQDQYVRNLILEYSNAPQLERLVFWRLIRLRMEFVGPRGSGITEEILQVELAKFLLSALGIDKHELFEAMHLKTRSLSEEAGRKGNQAEEEVFKIYSEQSEKAEKILENHFKQSP